MSEQTRGIDADRVVPWLEANVDGLTAPLEFSLIAGGRSNLTYKVTDAGGRAYVLRRPPLGQVLATAHDMSREHRIISALGPTPVPVPPTLAFCDDEAVNGAPFYVMAFVDGHVLRDAETAQTAIGTDQRSRAGESLVEVLAAIHSVDPDTVGLGELGRKEGYIARQLKRWYRQFQDSQTRQVPLVDEVHDLLQQHIPEQGPATIVHGDYRLDNCMVDDDGNVIAVLDWELCTLGDPLADLGLLMVYWTDPEDEAAVLAAAPTLAEGFPRRADLAKRYAEVSGRDVSQLDYYIGFGYWKLACILEGVYARYKGGSMGEDGADIEIFGTQVFRLAEMAKDALDRAQRA
jgi:aminoglycoside phosphotransferase (APT) family kinase protein